MQLTRIAGEAGAEDGRSSVFCSALIRVLLPRHRRLSLSSAKWILKNRNLQPFLVKFFDLARTALTAPVGPVEIFRNSAGCPHLI